MLNPIRLALFSVLLLAFSMAHAKPLAVEQATDPRGTTAVALSPDGRHVAMIAFNGYVRGLFLVDTATGTPKLIVGGKFVREGNWAFDKHPLEVAWVTNDLLAVDYGIEAESIDLTGKKVAEIGTSVIGKAEPDNPNSTMLLVYADEGHKGFARVNARTGDLDEFDLPIRGQLLQWAFDLHGELRAVTLRDTAFWRDEALVSNWYKPGRGKKWQKLSESHVTESYWTPLHVPDEAGKLIVMSNAGRDTNAVFSYDVQKRELGEMLAGHPTQDIVQVGGLGAVGLTSVLTRGLKPERIWFDRRKASAQASIDAALPGRINSLLSGDPAHLMLVYSYSDAEPGTWYLLDLKNGSLKIVAQSREAIRAEEMRPMEVMSYAARDGLAIPAYLTRPAAKTGPQPMVVLIHGGPTVRDTWGWNEEVQLLAAQGYVVFQPQFRGSSGFGRKFLEAGFGQWGLAMQDDVTDGVRHLIREGVADPARICIYGASYGGYAALWGLVKTPELYRCGVSFAGVADIEYMFNDKSDTNDSKAAIEFMRVTVGDVRFSKAQFDAVSPLKQAAKIAAPVLLMHGTRDKRVPISHSKKMTKALGDAGKSFEWESFEDEGQGFYYLRSSQKFYNRLFTFLDKYIGPGSTGSAAAPSGK